MEMNVGIQLFAKWTGSVKENYTSIYILTYTEMLVFVTLSNEYYILYPKQLQINYPYWEGNKT